MILRVKDKNGNVIEIPAIKGDRGKTGAPGYTPIKGIDYYTETDKSELVGQLKDELGVIYVFSGSVADEQELYDMTLPESDAGKVYNVIENGMNYAWTGSSWDALGMVYDVTDVVSSESDALVTSSGVAKSLKNIHFSDITGVPFGVNNNGDTGVIPYEYPLDERVKIYTSYGRPFINYPCIVTVKIMNNDTVLFSEECESRGSTVSIHNGKITLIVESVLESSPSSMGDYSGSWGIYATCTDIDNSLGANRIQILIGNVSTLPSYYLPENIPTIDNVWSMIDESLPDDIPTKEDVQSMIDKSMGDYDSALMSILGE